MSDKNKKQKNQTDGVALVTKERRKLYKNPAFLACMGLFFVVLVFFIIVLIATSVNGISFKKLFGIGSRIDYETDSLDKYIDIKEEDYSGIEINADTVMPQRDGVELEAHIMQLLSAQRANHASFGAAFRYEVPVTVGDKLYIYYRGYMPNEDGTASDICTNYGKLVNGNYEAGELYEYHLGDMSDIFPPSFAVALEGALVNKKDADFSPRYEGKVQMGEAVYVTLSYLDEHGIAHTLEDAKIDLSDENVKDIWGEEIEELLLSFDIGSECNYSVPRTCKTETGKKIYTYIKVKYVTDFEDSDTMCKVKVTYPNDWHEEDLRSKTAYFDVFIEKSLDYETPEFNDEFVTEVLKMTEEALSSYEGETLAQKYKSYYYEKLLVWYEYDKAERESELLWEALRDKLEISKIPEYELECLINAFYNFYSRDYELEREIDPSYYLTLEEHIQLCTGIDGDRDYEEGLYLAAKEELLDRLIVYTFLRDKGLISEDEDNYAEIYERELELDYLYYSSDCERAGIINEYKTKEAYADAQKAIFGEELYKNLIYRKFATAEMLKLAATD